MLFRSQLTVSATTSAVASVILSNAALVTAAAAAVASDSATADVVLLGTTHCLPAACAISALGSVVSCRTLISILQRLSSVSTVAPPGCMKRN